MSYRSVKSARRDLAEIAQSQGGYFTSKQAATAGYAQPHLDYHVRTGNFEHVARGIYRLSTSPPAEHDDLIRLSLWSRGRDDRPQAVISYETALGVYGLGNLLPSRMHLTVPRAFRKQPPTGCILHKAQLAEHEIEQREGFRVTTPLRTLLDVAQECGVTQEQLNEIVKQALAEGIIRRTKLVEAAGRQSARSRLSTALASAGP